MHCKSPRKALLPKTKTTYSPICFFLNSCQFWKARKWGKGWRLPGSCRLKGTKIKGTKILIDKKREIRWTKSLVLIKISDTSWLLRAWLTVWSEACDKQVGTKPRWEIACRCPFPSFFFTPIAENEPLQCTASPALPCNKMNGFVFIYTCGTSAINHITGAWTLI